MSYRRTTSIEAHASVVVDGTPKLRCNIDGDGMVYFVWTSDSGLSYSDFDLSLSRDALTELVRQGREALAVLKSWEGCAADDIGEVRIFDDAPTEVVPPGVSWREWRNQRQALSAVGGGR